MDNRGFKQYWLVLRRENGHVLPSTGAIIEIVPTLEEAQDKAKKLADQYQDKKFVVVTAIYEYCVKKLTVESEAVQP